MSFMQMFVTENGNEKSRAAEGDSGDERRAPTAVAKFMLLRQELLRIYGLLVQSNTGKVAR